MLKLIWHQTTITTNKEANDMVALFKQLKPKVGGFDTETNGLHIITSKPFLFQFGFINPNLKEGYTYAVDLERQPFLGRAVIKAWNKLAEELDLYLAHNIKFDLHMLANLGEPYNHTNVSDTMFYIRYAHDAKQPKEGGPPMGLKDYAYRYIDRHAKSHERLLSIEKSEIAQRINIQLRNRLFKCGRPPEKYGTRTYTIGTIQKMFSDCTVSSEDLPPDVKEVYLEWLQQDVPVYIQPKVTGLVEADMIPYDKLNRENILKYAHYDIIYVLELYLLTLPSIEVRKTMNAIEIESKLIYPFWEMERCGFQVNKNYLELARIKMKSYIRERRARLYEIAGTEFSVSQHAFIKTKFEELFNISLPTTDSSELKQLVETLKAEGSNEGAIEFIKLIRELRTLEKWYATYILRFLKDLRNTDRLYTTINQVGTVSGRISSDFQQFPKKGITTVDDEEIFKPRKMVTVSGGEYNGLLYLDYSQIELRFQAFYTILVGHPDLNLCRAYMPYKCVNNDGRTFDYTNLDDITNWQGEWYYEEDREKHWEATDVHGATTTEATGLTPEDGDIYEEARSVIGKRTNFAKNYGAQYGKIKEMFPDKSPEEVKKIDDAYYKAFPGVKQYHNYCYDRAMCASYTENMFGIRYYGVNGHKLINMLVQGSAAFFLKLKIIELYEYAKKHSHNSRLQMQIHDELSWEVSMLDNPEVFFEYKKIMEDWSDTYVPIVAEMEASVQTWANKTKIKNVEKLKELLDEA